MPYWRKVYRSYPHERIRGWRAVKKGKRRITKLKLRLDARKEIQEGILDYTRLHITAEGG